jgi:hypothetical protein
MNSHSTETRHVALLGDSIFDNAAYTMGEPDVIGHLRTVLPDTWRASLCALDSSTISGLPAQIAKVPADASHLVVSIGGNDAILNADVLNLPVSSTREALLLFGERVGRFEADYREGIDRVLQLRRPTILCTIYNGNLHPDEAPTARIALMLFNDVILRTAFDRGLDVLDLRTVCSEPADYANPIEPSGRGGRKIALAIASAIGAIDPKRCSRVFAGA